LVIGRGGGHAIHLAVLAIANAGYQIRCTVLTTWSLPLRKFSSGQFWRVCVSRGNSRLRGMPLTRYAATNATRNLALMTFAKVTLIPLTSITKPGPTVIVRSLRQIGQLGGPTAEVPCFKIPHWRYLAVCEVGSAAHRACGRLIISSHYTTLAHSLQHIVAFHSSPPQNALDR